MERNTLMAKCYPRIKDYCREKHGLEFQVGGGLERGDELTPKTLMPMRNYAASNCVRDWFDWLVLVCPHCGGHQLRSLLFP